MRPEAKEIEKKAKRLVCWKAAPRHGVAGDVDQGLSWGGSLSGMNALELVDFASDAAFAVDRRLRVAAWNEQAHALLGYSPEEVLERPCWDVLQGVLPQGQPLCTPECQAKLCFCCARPFAAPALVARRKDGSRIELTLSSIALPPHAQESEGILAVVFLRPPGPGTPSAHPGTDEALRVFTLGCFCLVVGGKGIPLGGWARKQALTLLKYLVTERGRAVHRERLMEALWPEASERAARERLRVTVYFLRRALREAGVPEPEGVIETIEGGYRLRRDRVWVDADVFEERLRLGRALEEQGKFAEALERYREAEALYGGDYLEDDPYADWYAEERGRLRELYLDLLGRLAHLYAARGEYAEAAQLCRKALVREPCREGFHRALMEYLWRQGRRDEALAQFARLRKTLARELGVDPLPETRALYERILR